MDEPIPNPRFSGMSAVNSESLFDAVDKYFPDQKNRGKNRLKGLNTVDDLDSLINYCIQGTMGSRGSGMRAFGDSVLQGARHITVCPNEIAVAKDYVRDEVNNYLIRNPSAVNYNDWHQGICETLSNPAEHFVDCGEFTIGNAQKFLNMLMKDLYACLYVTSEKTQSEHGALERLKGYQSFNQACNDIHSRMKADGYDFDAYFAPCHMPLDSFTLKFLKEIYRPTQGKLPPNLRWSLIRNYVEYSGYQDIIRDFVSASDGKTTPTVLQTKFVIWPQLK